MDTREKLIELMCSFQNEHNSVVPDRQGLADHLIANGVTIATDNKVGDKKSPTADNLSAMWIPVTERLPEDDSHVLAYLRIGEEGRIYPASYAKGVWWDCIFSTPATKTTTHWMPLPEPPKGE